VIATPLPGVVAALVLLATPAPADEPAVAAPLLRLEDAVTAAERQNHALAASGLELEKVDERSAAARTRRLPALRLDAVGSRLLKSLDFTFPTGAFGTFPQIGPVPAAQTSVSTPTDFTATFVASVSQPLTQQYRIGLGLEALRLDHDVAGEDLRKERQRVAAEVRTTYYQLSATEAGVVALRDLVRAIEEVDAVTGRYLTEDTVLRSEALEVKARLARERQRLDVAESSLATQREHLNQLMGREIGTAFRVAQPSELVASARVLTIDAARERALGNRPEVRKALLRVDQADTARRIAHSQWIPDVTLVASYARNVNYQVIPDEVATVGVALTWEPFDWGRRKHEAGEQAVAKKQAQDGHDETAQQIAVEVGGRWRAVKDAATQLEATRIAEDAAKAYLDDVKNRYREDASMLHDVLEAEARLSRARHDFTDALAGYWSATAELERTIGDENA
jgi:outer membrane protein TolC